MLDLDILNWTIIRYIIWRGITTRKNFFRIVSTNDTKTIYLLDEPTVGLHFEDVKRLIEVLNKLVERGNTVVLIEHNLDVIKCADYLLDFGPEGGTGGGQL
jgi:excinuclease ABC subunit A